MQTVRTYNGCASYIAQEINNYLQRNPGMKIVSMCSVGNSVLVVFG